MRQPPNQRVSTCCWRVCDRPPLTCWVRLSCLDALLPQVPFPVEANLSGVGQYHPRMWYRRQLWLPAAWPHDARVLLHFDAVDQEASVWLNGESLGSHAGGYSRFSCAAQQRSRNHVLQLCGLCLILDVPFRSGIPPLMLLHVMQGASVRQL